MLVRQSLPFLAREGLLVPSGRRGFAVRSLTREDCLAAIRLRAALEGLAAAEIAQRSADPSLLEQFDACLRAGDDILAKREIAEEDETLYAEADGRFHGLPLQGAANTLLSELIERCNLVPFAFPASVAFEGRDLRSAYVLLSQAHRQHRAIVDALAAGKHRARSSSCGSTPRPSSRA